MKWSCWGFIHTSYKGDEIDGGLFINKDGSDNILFFIEISVGWFFLA